VEQLLEMFDLQDRAGEKVGNYSKGMKQRLALARALIHRPEILFLDEPTAGLDPVVTRRVHELIVHLSREEARTVFLCTHNLAEAQKLCNRVAVLEHGKLVALGTPAELARTAGRSQNLKVEVAPEGLSAARAVLANAGLREADQAMEEPGTLLLSGVERESIPSLVAALVGAGVRLYRVASQEPSLEDIYFALQSSLPENQEAES
jgi:ABC-2 type transport system ATP-binding protein